jgi:hypothetical protein
LQVKNVEFGSVLGGGPPGGVSTTSGCFPPEDPGGAGVLGGFEGFGLLTTILRANTIERIVSSSRRFSVIVCANVHTHWVKKTPATIARIKKFPIPLHNYQQAKRKTLHPSITINFSAIIRNIKLLLWNTEADNWTTRVTIVVENEYSRICIFCRHYGGVKPTVIEQRRS